MGYQVGRICYGTEAEAVNSVMTQVVPTIDLLVRSDDGTQLCEVRTKHPEKYQHFKRDQVVTLEIHPRAFKDNVYYSDER